MVRNEQDYNVAKLAEESGELTQIVMKTLVYGIKSHNPETGESNVDLLRKEMGDVIACIQLVAGQYGISIDQLFIEERKQEMHKGFVLSQIR